MDVREVESPRNPGPPRTTQTWAHLGRPLLLGTLPGAAPLASLCICNIFVPTHLPLWPSEGPKEGLSLAGLTGPGEPGGHHEGPSGPGLVSGPATPLQLQHVFVKAALSPRELLG